MRRTSKRWLQCLFTINEYRSFDIDAVNESFSRVTLDGVACRLRASPDTRAALQRGHVVRGRVVSIPGLPDDPSSRPWWVDEWQWNARERRRSASLVCVDADTPESHPDGDLFKAFIRRYPPGSAIEASVVAEREHSVELLLPEGIRAYVPIRRRRKATLGALGCGWWRLPLPARLECLVTGYELEHWLIFMVSFHPINYPGYCNAVAGYRSRFNHWAVPLRDRLEGRPRFLAQ